MMKITGGLNDRPKDASLAHSDPALTNDSSRPVGATEEDALKVRSKLDRTGNEARKDDADDLAKQFARPKHENA
jgi:hypothetical protein